eukprot:Rhum_TRINITY_DN2636_c0_g1::Rhum_TRINITY_DN2636_c0_g1_i1::g.7815::m.7815
MGLGKYLAQTQFSGHVVTGTIAACVVVCSVLNGMQWERRTQMNLLEALHLPWTTLLYELATHPLYFHTMGELIFGGAILASAAVDLERQWGAEKFAGFLCSAHFIGWTVRLLLVHFHIGPNTVLPGPYFILFAMVYAHAAYAPRTPLYYMYYAVPITAASATLLYAAQLAFLHTTDSFCMGLCGLIAGYVCCSNAYTYLPMPSLTHHLRRVLPHRLPKVTVLTSQVLHSRIPNQDAETVDPFG